MAEWVKAATTEECSGEGCVHAATPEGEAVVVVKVDGEYFALEDRCSHQDFPLSDGSIENGQIECVFHGARFDVRTGKAKSLPAIKPVKTYPVEVRGDEIWVQVGG
ncbi:MAG: non-heme iron oxygenase ferredoxin subunit [Gemmatimonadales bacterium]|nr:MAG: non-heme iron oxygenase ferredoxin subunit [Gemmatimonadales bacterium]